MANGDSKSELDVRGNRVLSERLLSHGWEFDFFQAVWLLERYAKPRVPVGGLGPVSDESLRFRPDIELGFPPTDVRRITLIKVPGTDKSFYRVEVTFLGLYGTATPLPLHYAVSLLRSVDQAPVETIEPDQPATSSDPPVAGTPAHATSPLRDFFDIYHHRLISLFYRSWLKYRYERAFGLPERDVITKYLQWLIGWSPSQDETLLGVSPIRILRYAGVWTQHPRSATTLEGVLADYWGDVAVESHQCVGRWVSVPDQDRNRLGRSCCTLGEDLTLGAQVFDLSGAFSLTFGPMDWSTYLVFLPKEERFVQTCALVKYYADDPLALRFELRLRGQEAPELRLTSDDQAGRLGYTTWLRTDPVPETCVHFDATPTVWAQSSDRAEVSSLRGAERREAPARA